MTNIKNSQCVKIIYHKIELSGKISDNRIETVQSCVEILSLGTCSRKVIFTGRAVIFIYTRIVINYFILKIFLKTGQFGKVQLQGKFVIE